MVLSAGYNAPSYGNADYVNNDVYFPVDDGFVPVSSSAPVRPPPAFPTGAFNDGPTVISNDW